MQTPCTSKIGLVQAEEKKHNVCKGQWFTRVRYKKYEGMESPPVPSTSELGRNLFSAPFIMNGTALAARGGSTDGRPLASEGQGCDRESSNERKSDGPNLNRMRGRIKMKAVRITSRRQVCRAPQMLRTGPPGRPWRNKPPMSTQII
jgi:hypothetical protein